jgi:hypothetical protein
MGYNCLNKQTNRKGIMLILVFSVIAILAGCGMTRTLIVLFFLAQAAIGMSCAVIMSLSLEYLFSTNAEWAIFQNHIELVFANQNLDWFMMPTPNETLGHVLFTLPFHAFWALSKIVFVVYRDIPKHFYFWIPQAIVFYWAIVMGEGVIRSVLFLTPPRNNQ